MTKIDIFSGFLGAGKTTLIKKLINEAYKGEKLVLIENEFGEIGIDGGFLKDAGIEITEMNSGCICCSLVGDFGEALKKVLCDFSPDRILIEPSGVGKLSDVIRAVKGIDSKDAVLNGFTTVADANKCKMYMKNFGEFFNDQIKNAGTVILSHTSGATDEKIKVAVELIKEQNPNAVIVTTDWDKLDGKDLLAAIERTNSLQAELENLEHEHHEHKEHCHEHGAHCTCGCHEHGHHEHHEHHHEHEHNNEHHHADDVFSSWGIETTNKYTKEQLTSILKAFEDDSKYGMVLRAKGIVEGEDGNWLHFDYVPGEPDIRSGSPEVTGRLCVIGSKIDEEILSSLFGVK